MKPVQPIKPIRPKPAIGEITDWRAFRVRPLQAWLSFVRTKAKSRKRRASLAAASTQSSVDQPQPPSAQGQHESNGVDGEGHIDKLA